LKMRLLGHYKANQWLRSDVINIHGDTLIGNAIRRLATEVDDLSEIGIARQPSHEFHCEATTRSRPAA
jgi:hypothetical protein